jgi:anaerobic carbon-monoxide dehydrogenase iron sulfur subunit
VGEDGVPGRGMKFRLLEKRCTGCQLCQLACSSVKEGSYGLKQSRIRILSSSRKREPKIVVCRQCKKCKCIEACPYNAFRKDGEVGGIYIDFEECQACLACVEACPFGAVALDLKNNLPMVCDLCGGHPPCVEVCGREAIQTRR